MAETWGLTPGQQAADVLNLSLSGLIEAMGAGDLDGVIVGGQVYVVAEQVQLRLLDEVRRGTTAVTETRTLVRTALRGFLADRPVVALWDEAIGDRRPLVCARRGATRVHYGIEFHSVVMKVQWLVEYSTDPQVRARHPEIAGLPAGPVLARAVAEMPGVSQVRYATPLADQGELDPQSHRLSGWVRLDPQVWALRLPDGIARLVNGEQVDR